ncbi:2'-5' RNA ligase family protein [Mycolicibacterium sp. P9-64]|uniref:2'-5' RNA ligase family protein n=1 Tax=Mycolicibacterium sp. P9-64 TaxID=2024612 RepID=UPI0011ED4D7B|nr:2'-5' RNA ligase family protein [Mycolicibacterium sp. P9-64]KAA0084241.1 2'-5' RNA ligase family protein [Mycolicibacterium sp. P9-64]
MAHSVELVFDQGTEAAVRRVWAALAEAGLRSQAPTSRPHVTLTVAESIDAAVDASLAALVGRFPFPCRIGAPLVFGRTTAVLARLVVPSAELMDVQAEVYRRCLPHLHPGPMDNVLPGRWTPHVTMARRVDPDRVGPALRIVGQELVGSAIGLRRWNGDEKLEFPIS